MELRQSLSADINTESLGLCVGESVGDMGIFNARSCGADREGSQLLERVEGAVTRDLENKKQGWICLFPEHDEDVDYILSCC